MLSFVARAHAEPVLPPDTNGGFSAVMVAVNEGETLGAGVALRSVSIDKNVVRLTFVLGGSDQAEVELGAPDGSRAPVGQWFRVTKPPEDARLAKLLPRLGELIDREFGESPWVEPTGPAPVPEKNRAFLFWPLLFCAVLAWGIYSLRVRRRPQRVDDESGERAPDGTPDPQGGAAGEDGALPRGD